MSDVPYQFVSDVPNFPWSMFRIQERWVTAGSAGRCVSDVPNHSRTVIPSFGRKLMIIFSFF